MRARRPPGEARKLGSSSCPVRDFAHARLSSPGPRQLPSLRMCRPPSLASMGTCLAREDGEHDGSDRPAPEPGPTGDTADAGGLRGVPGSRVPVGAPAAVPALRARGLLRFLAAAARARARLRGRAPDRGVVRAGRVLALVLF